MSDSKVLRLTVAQAIVKFLQRQFSDFDGSSERLIAGMFGIFGHGNVATVSQALEEYGRDLPFYQPKNEQSMVHSAIGFAKAKNRRSTFACSASIGPGSTNMITGAAAATINRVPVLLLPADVFSHRRPGNVLQQLEHPIDRDVSVNDCFRPVSRYFDRISRPEQILESLPEAMRVLTDPADTGAVTIALPQDVEGEVYDFPERFFEMRVWPIRRVVPSEQDVSAAIEAIRQSARPLIIAGGGVRYSAAQQVLRELSNHCGIAVGETHAGKGVALDADYSVGGVGVTGTRAAARLAERADLVIAVGSRLQDFVTGSRSAFRNPNVRFVSINVNAHDAHKIQGVHVIGDAKNALEVIAKGLRDTNYSTADAYRKEIRSETLQWKKDYTADIQVTAEGSLTQGTVIKMVNDIAGPDDVVIAAAGTPPGEIHKGWDNANGSQCFLEFGYSTMGHEIPAGLGVRLARPNRGQVYVIIGDGTYLMAPTEIVTAVQERAKITILVIENGGYQCIRDLQQKTTGIEDLGNEFRMRAERPFPSGDYVNIDFESSARSMGATSMTVDTPDTLRKALEGAINQHGPVVIVAKVDKRHVSIGGGIWWDVGVAQTSMLDRVRQAAENFHAGAEHQRSLT